MERTNVYLTEAQLERLRAISKEGGLSVAEIIRRAVDQWIERRDKKDRGKAQGRER